MQKRFNGMEPRVTDSAFVSEISYLVGDVTVGEDASIWPFVCLRGDVGPTAVGQKSNIQEFTMLHDADVGESVTVGHNVVIDRASVDDLSLVGISSTLLPGSEIGSNCIIAAGTVVRENQTIPDEHIAYGVPADIEPLNEGQRERISKVFSEYVELKEQYRAAGQFE